MFTYFTIILCFVIVHSEKVLVEGNNEVKRGVFPFMAFIYYPDETIVDARGIRFLRSAVLIRPDWLVTSAVGPSILNTPNAFPLKTLLARLGAVTIESNIPLNEDEDEQEREVIEIIRPYNHSATQWWFTDISLMKTLMPFNMTSAVNFAQLNFKQDYSDKNCFILVYSKRYGNVTEDKILMQLAVELLPSSIEVCGPHFAAETMICAADSNEHKNAIYDPDFCQGNSGGPILCDNEVFGLQTYIENSCKQPHLYQLMSAWDNFITCGTDECASEKCENVCIVATKDNPDSKLVTPTQTAKSDILLVETEMHGENLSTTATVQEIAIQKNTSLMTPTKTTISTTTSKDPTTAKTSQSTSSISYITRALNDDTEDTTDWSTETNSEEIKEIERRITVEAQQVATVSSGAKAVLCVFQIISSAFLVSACLA